MARIIVTGGSGFIGTNLIEYFLGKGHELLNIDIAVPRNKSHLSHWRKVDILDRANFHSECQTFNPDYVVHLAARTDLHENESIEGYAANIAGVQNMVDIVNELPAVRRAVYASSRMVCRIDYVPENFYDYCPPNYYGESKKRGEEIVRKDATHDYVIVRPTSIWGPFFEVPYRTFFDTVRKGLFFIPKGHNPRKSFGFVYNTVYQIEQILFAEKNMIENHYYLTDYPSLELKTWADLIAKNFQLRPVKQISMPILKVAAAVGDLFQKMGWKNVPLTTFRLTNLITHMEYNTASLEKLCGKLPYSLEEGVEITVKWMKQS